MSIPVTCSDCQSHFHVGDEFAGRPGRCPDCGHVLEVPDPAADPAVHAEDPDPHHPYGTPHFEHPPLPAPLGNGRPTRDDYGEEDHRADDGDVPPRPRTDPRRPKFDPHERAAKWARVHRGLGYLQVAVVLGFTSQTLQTILMIARGGVRQNPNGLPDSGQVALAVGAVFMVLAAWMFWVLGRVGGVRVPYLPARNSARASLVLAMGSIGGCMFSFCFLIGALGAAQNPGNGGEAAVLMALTLCVMLLTVLLAAGAEVAGLVSLGRIGDALRDRAAATWARRSIVVMLVAVGLIMFGLCGVVAYAAAHAPPPPRAQGGANAGAAGAQGKEKGKDKADHPKDAAPAQPPAANGAAQNPPPAEPDETLTMVMNLVFFIPLILYLLHYSMALQAGRRAIRREIDVLTGRDHGEHDRPY